MRRSLVVLAASGAMCLGASACTGPSGPGNEAEVPATNGTFTMVLTDDIGTFDPYRNNIMNYDQFAYDSLVNLRPDGSFVTGLAEEWRVDATSATFTLRSDVTCSDGTPLTASQVAADLNYLGDPANGSPLYGSALPTVPFRVTADDANRAVQVTGESPFGFLLNTIGTTPIMCANGLRNPELLASGSDGTGPYVLTEVVPGQRFTFTARDGYTWGPDGAGTDIEGLPATVVMRVVPNETTAANLLLSGEVNMARIGGQDRQRLDQQNLEKIEYPQSGAWLWFNEVGGRPGADPLVRQALVQAIDLEEVIQVNTAGNGSAASGVAETEPKACPGNTVEGQLPAHDTAAAQNLLDRAGWSLGSDGVRVRNGERLTIDLHYSPSWGSSLDRPTADLLAERWAAIGVAVDLTADSRTGFLQVLYETSDFDVYMAGSSNYLPSSIVPYVSGPTPPEGSNFAGIDNEQYLALVDQAKSVTGSDACALWAEAEQALWRDFNPVPIAKRPWVFFLNGAEAQTAGFDLAIPTSVRVLE